MSLQWVVADSSSSRLHRWSMGFCSINCGRISTFFEPLDLSTTGSAGRQRLPPRISCFTSTTNRHCQKSPDINVQLSSTYGSRKPPHCGVWCYAGSCPFKNRVCLQCNWLGHNEEYRCFSQLCESTVMDQQSWRGKRQANPKETCKVHKMPLVSEFQQPIGRGVITIRINRRPAEFNCIRHRIWLSSLQFINSPNPNDVHLPVGIISKELS